MGPLAQDDTRRLARLAGLRLSEDEVEHFTGQLRAILSRIDTLPEAETLKAENEVGAPSNPRAPLRSDEPGPDPLERPPAELAPAWRDGFFTLPRLEPFGPEPTKDPAG